jgi:hypothetical protein
MSEAVINYIIRSGFSLALLYLFFTLFLSRDKMHRFNRYYLIASLIFSFIIPTLTIPAFITSNPVTSLAGFSNLQDSYVQLQLLTPQKESQFNFERLILFLYFSISLLLLFRFIFNLIRLEISKKVNPSTEYAGHRIILINDLVLPYSFLSTIYVNSGEYKEGRIPKELFSHEISHISQRHSLDIIFIELLKVFFWFNPFIYFFKKAIMLNHEYLADEAVTYSENNSKSYINILLNVAFRNNNSYLASSFNYSFTKKRLLMMTKNKFSKSAMLKKIAIIPLFLLLGLLVMNAQDTKSVKSNAPPPPPPPPPFGYNSWWEPILKEQNVTPNSSKIWTTQTLYETGEQFSKVDNIVTMKEAFILAKSVNNLYRIIKAKSATHDLTSNMISCQGIKVDTYKWENNVSTHVDTEYYKDLAIKISDGIIAPPPPPPPPPAKFN